MGMALIKTLMKEFMKKRNLIELTFIFAIALASFPTIGWAQSGNEFTVPLSDPAKKGKLKAQINYGSINVKGTARKDVLVKYTTPSEGTKDNTTSSCRAILSTSTLSALTSMPAISLL
jgi:hypothetical protein